MAVTEGGSFINEDYMQVLSHSRLHTSNAGSLIINNGLLIIENGGFVQVFDHAVFENQDSIGYSGVIKGMIRVDSEGLFINHASGKTWSWIENPGGTVVNNGEAYICFNHSELSGTSTDPLLHDVLAVQDSLHLTDEALVLEFAGGLDESQLNHGDFFDIVLYPGPTYRVGEFTSVQDTLAALDQGTWELIYDQPAGESYSIRLVYNEDLTPVPEFDLPSQFALLAPYPNPFNPMTTIAFDLPPSCSPSIRIYDLAGRLVWSREESGVLSAGRHEMTWQGIDSVGRSVPSGSYLLRMTADEFRMTRRMMLVR